MFFNIHNLIKIKVYGRKDHFNRLSHFMCEDSNDADIIVRIGDFKPNLDGYKQIKKKYFVGEHSIYCKDHHKLWFFKVWIKGLDQKKTFVYFTGNLPFSKSMLVYMIIEPLILYKLSKKGVLFLHGSSISINNKGFIFSSNSGVGKTSVALKMLNDSSAKYFSDDKSIIQDLNLLSYITPIGVRTHHLLNCKLNLSLFDILLLTLENAINIATFYFGSFSHPLDINKVSFQGNKKRLKLGNNAKMDGVFLMEIADKPFFGKINSSEAFYLLEKNIKRDKLFTIMSKFIYAFKQVYSDFDFWKYFDKALYKFSISNTPFYKLQLDRQYNFINDLFKNVKNVTNSKGIDKFVEPNRMSLWEAYWVSNQQSTIVGNFTHWFYLHILQKALNRLNITNKAKILDMGCGRGTTLNKFREFGFSNSIGIDLSEQGFHRCQIDFGFQLGKDVFKMDATKTSYPDKNFDLVFSEGLLEHFIDYTPFVKEMIRISNKYVIIIQPNHLSLEGAFFKLGWQLLRKNAGGVVEFTYSMSHFIKTFEHLNFKCVKKIHTVANAILIFERQKSRKKR